MFNLYNVSYLYKYESIIISIFNDNVCAITYNNV